MNHFVVPQYSIKPRKSDLVLGVCESHFLSQLFGSATKETAHNVFRKEHACQTNGQLKLTQSRQPDIMSTPHQSQWGHTKHHMSDEADRVVEYEGYLKPVLPKQTTWHSRFRTKKNWTIQLNSPGSSLEKKKLQGDFLGQFPHFVAHGTLSWSHEQHASCFFCLFTTFVFI